MSYDFWDGATSSSGIGTWGQPSQFGPAYRASVRLPMSAYDTNPASTDHTSAFQAALTAAAAILSNKIVSLVEIVLDSRQVYTIGAAPTLGPNGENAQIPLPFFDASVSPVVGGCIRFVGMPINQSYFPYGGGDGTVIRSTLTASPTWVAANGVSSIMGGPSSYSSVAFASRKQNALQLAFQDVTFQQGNVAGTITPVICGVDAGFLAGLYTTGTLRFSTPYWDGLAQFPFGMAGVPVCANPQGIALVTPLINNISNSVADVIVSNGYYAGIVIGEAINIRQLKVFASQLGISVDVAQVGSTIDEYIDFNNGYGIATTTPAGGGPGQGPSTTGKASNFGPGGCLVSPLQIGMWTNALCASTGPNGLKRIADVVDGNASNAFVEAKMRTNQGGSGGTGIAYAPVVQGSGGSTTGSTNQHIVDVIRAPGGRSFGPTSGTAFRNPYGRDAFIVITAGAFTAVAVDGINYPTTATTIPVRAQSVITLTWTTAPTWTFYLI